MEDLTEHEDLLRGHAEHVEAAEERLRLFRSGRDEAIRAAIQDGMSMYRIAQIVGISQQSVARIRDAD